MFSLKCFILLAIIASAYADPKRIRITKNKPLKIEDGRDAQSGEFPYIASLQWGILGIDEHICGGVILNEAWVLTTASCANDAQKVIVGALDLHNNDPDKQKLDIEKKILHPDYDSENGGPNDIAVLKLKTPLTFNDNVQPAKLPEQGAVANGTADVAGYGQSILPDWNRLQIVTDSPLLSFDECNKALDDLLGDDNVLDEQSNLCSGDLKKASNYCDGDFGSPLVQNGTVVGVVTWIITPCDYPGTPNVHTNVANFAKWVQETTESN